MKKRIFATMLVATMLTGLCTGCGKEGNVSKETESQSAAQNSVAEDSGAEDSVESSVEEEDNGWLVDEETELTALIASNYEITEDTWIFQKIKERTGIAIKPICYTYEVAAEKLSTYIASQELPDMMFGLLQIGDVHKYGQVGAFASPMDYLDIMPNYKALFIDNAYNYETFKGYNAPDGKNYSIPYYGLNRDVNFGIMYRADVFEELGIEVWEPGDTEAFYDALVALKKAYPDSYPLTAAFEVTTTMLRWSASFDGSGAYLGYEDDKWYLNTTTEAYKEFLDFFQKLYAEGLMDPEFFSDNLDAFNEAFLNDRSFVCNEWIGRMALLDTAAKEMNPDSTFDLVYAPPIGRGVIPGAGQMGGFGNVVANNENTEIAMKFVDWMYTDEASELFTIGAEGENFVWDENGKPKYLEIEPENVSINTLEEKYGMWIGSMYLRPDRRSCYFNFTEKEQAAQDLINNECGYCPVLPQQTFDPKFNDEYATLYTKLKTDTDAFMAKYITNPSWGDAEWEDFVKTLKKECGDRVLEIVNLEAK